VDGTADAEDEPELLLAWGVTVVELDDGAEVATVRSDPPSATVTPIRIPIKPAATTPTATSTTNDGRGGGSGV
jgi:hypothetical protein